MKNYISTLYDKLHITGTPKQKQHALTGIFSKSRKYMTFVYDFCHCLYFFLTV